VLDGRPVRHALEVRHRSFCNEAFVALARERGIAIVFTDAEQHPSLADITGAFVYARLMRTRDEVATGYPDAELDQWAQRVREWAGGGDPQALPHVGERRVDVQPRDVFAYIIGGAKHRNPAAATGLIERLRMA